MAKPTSKSELLTTAAAGYEQLNELIASLTEQELSTPFSFDEKMDMLIEWIERL